MARHALAARGGVDEHALHLRVTVRTQDEGAAAERAAVLARDEEVHVRRGQRIEVDQMIALRRIERLHQRVGLADQRDNVVLARCFT